MSSDFDLEEEYAKKIKRGNILVDSLSKVQAKVNGINKLRAKINQELKFLQKVRNSAVLKKEHLVCSNIQHFDALISKLLGEENIVSVLEVFHYEDDNGCLRKICVDILSQHKMKWTKVIARNPKALSQISKGEAEYQRKSVLDHANEFIKCASQNIIYFNPPSIEFHFACGVENELALELSKLGVYISGQIIINEVNENLNEFEHLSLQCSNNINVLKLNLDVTAMIAYVSALTNGHADKKVKGQILTEQAEWEKLRPVKPELDKFFDGKELYACQTALASFKSILAVIGGPGEKSRGQQFVQLIKEVEDIPCSSLIAGGQIRPRSLTVFGTGQAIQAITVTANSAFVRAAKHQGVHFDVFIHEPRSLTERKELD